ncbi:MAG: hypothetical protein R2844_03305 [Caldilineales bacterium]
MRRNINVHLAIGLILALVLTGVHPTFAAPVTPTDAAEQIRSALVEAQLALATDPAAALALAEESDASYAATLAPRIAAAAPEAHGRALAAFARLAEAARTGDAVAFAAARGHAWTAILAGSEQVVEAALRTGDPITARAWLTVREYRTATRYSRASADATLAVEQFATGQMTADDAALTVRADLFGTYQARLDEALRDLAEADAHRFAVRRAELASLAAGYFAVLVPAYAEQRGAAGLATASGAFDGLMTAAMRGNGLPGALDAVHGALDGFRAAPLSPAEQAQRAGQLLRYIGLIPVEYGRAIDDGRVIHDFEVQEAVTFHEAAYAAFSELNDLLPADTVARSVALFDQIGTQLAGASETAAAQPAQVKRDAEELIDTLKAAMPEAWLAGSSQGDFVIIASLLDQVESAVRNGQYDMADSARLEAYATLETGPEARLVVLAPQLKPVIESLFWNGQGEHKGLARLLANEATPGEVQATRAELDALLAEAEGLLAQESSPVSVATNAGLIVFREGMEAVIILAALMSSMRRAEERRYRKPMWAGTGLALLATAGIWVLAHSVLQSLALRRKTGGRRVPDCRRRAAGHHELVPAQDLLDKLDRPVPQPQAPAVERRGRAGAGACGAGLRQRLPRGVRGGAVPAGAGAGVRHGSGAGRDGGRAAVGGPAGRADVQTPGAAALQNHACGDRRPDRAGVAPDHRQDGLHHAGGRLDADSPDPADRHPLLVGHLVRRLPNLGRAGVAVCGGRVRHRQLLPGRTQAKGQTATAGAQHIRRGVTIKDGNFAAKLPSFFFRLSPKRAIGRSPIRLSAKSLAFPMTNGSPVGTIDRSRQLPAPDVIPSPDEPASCFQPASSSYHRIRSFETASSACWAAMPR